MITYARLYADESGESHFEEVEMNLTLTDYAPPAPPLNLSASLPAAQVRFMSAPAGWASDWASFVSPQSVLCDIGRMGGYGE